MQVQDWIDLKIVSRSRTIKESSIGKEISFLQKKIRVGTEVVYSKTLKASDRLTPTRLVDYLDERGSGGYSLSANRNNSSTIDIVADTVGAQFNGVVTVTLTVTGGAPGYVATDVTGGMDAPPPMPSDASTSCRYTKHIHEYDDLYDKTGVNMLNASNNELNLSRAISGAQEFKVLLMNQYLSPAAMLHSGDRSYDPASAAGYVYVKNYQTGDTLDVTALETYTLSTIGSLVLNLPVDAFGPRDWWGNGDVRNGLLPNSPQCVFYGSVTSGGGVTGSVIANMYSPVVPPAATETTSGVPATSSTAATGARHGGALAVQIIKSTTPQSAIEQNVSGRPEFGYRVKQEYFFEYVLAEYSIFWHHPRRVCFGDSTTTWYNGSTGGNGFGTASKGVWNTTSNMSGTGWTKNAPEDSSEAATSSTPVNGSTDPKLGSFGSISGSMGGVGSGGGDGTTPGSTTDIHNEVVTGGGVGSSTNAGGQGASGVPGMGTSAGGGFNTGETGSNLKMKRLTWREIFK